MSFSAGIWFVSIPAEQEVPTPQATSAIGINIEIARFAKISDGTHLEPLNRFKRHEVRQRKAQRAMNLSWTLAIMRGMIALLPWEISPNVKKGNSRKAVIEKSEVEVAGATR